ncbi:hypothetical protein LTS12_027194, partial [Elasticomyces elasticus]
MLTNSGGFARPTTIDHRTWLWVVIILSMLYAFCFLVARVFAKWSLLWWDDALTTLAHIFAAVRWTLMIVAIRQGLGADLAAIGRVQAEDELARLTFASRLLLIFCLYISRLSLAIFTRKVFAGNMHRENMLLASVFGNTALCGLASLIVSAAGCQPNAMLIGNDSALCAATGSRWIVVSVLDILSELPLIILPIYLVSKVQMGDSKKRAVSYGFVFRAGYAVRPMAPLSPTDCASRSMIFAIVQAVTYKRFLNGGRTSIGLVPTLALQEIWLVYSLLSSTVPCLRGFVGAFTTNGLIITTQTTMNQSNQGHSIALSLRKDGKRNRRGVDDDAFAHSLDKSNLCPGVAYDVDVSHGNEWWTVADRGEQASVASDSSEQMIIKRDTRVDVQIEPRSILDGPS